MWFYCLHFPHYVLFFYKKKGSIHGRNIQR
nr:MAG TPA: hypothetical protein [Caudoviricetes sp.]